jgi:hypothetical protein
MDVVAGLQVPDQLDGTFQQEPPFGIHA